MSGVPRPHRPFGGAVCAATGLAPAPRAAPLPRLPAVRVAAGKGKKNKQQQRKGRGSQSVADLGDVVQRARLADVLQGGGLQGLGGALGLTPLPPFGLPFGGGLFGGMGGLERGLGLELSLEEVFRRNMAARISPLHLAARLGDAEVLERTLRKLRHLPAGPEDGNMGDDGEEGPGDEDDEAFAVLQQFAHPDAPDFEGETPLHYACHYAYTMQLQHKQGGGRKAAGANTRRVMELLLSTGAHADAYTHDGQTPSMLVVAHVEGGDAVPDLALLQRYGADLHVLDEQGRSLLMRAAAAGNVEAARWLLEQGLDAGVVDMQGMRAAQYAHTQALRKELQAAASAGAGACTSRGGGISSSSVPPPPAVLPARKQLVLPPGCTELDPRGLVWGRLLGSGAFAAVHAGTYHGQPVAIKLANLHTDKAQHTFEAQQQELSALAHLAAAAAAAHHSPDGAAAGGGSGAACGGGGGVGSHPHLVEFKGLVSRRDGAQALVLGRCRAALSYEVMAKLSAEDRYRIALQTAKGLAFMHACGVVHKDFKMDNVLLDAEGNARICDLGISAIISPSAAAGAVADAELPREDSFTGNIAWSAPERLNRKPYSGKADVWSWGILLFELASWSDGPGSGAFQGLDIQKREALLRNPTGMGPQHLGPLLRSRLNSVGTLDAAVHGLIGDCLESQPSQRPSMQQVLERLEGVADKALQRPGPKQAPRRKPQQGQQQGAGVDQNVRKDVDKGKKGKKGKRS